jgi:hypothetical protein
MSLIQRQPLCREWMQDMKIGQYVLLDVRTHSGELHVDCINKWQRIRDIRFSTQRLIVECRQCGRRNVVKIGDDILYWANETRARFPTWVGDDDEDDDQDEYENDDIISKTNTQGASVFSTKVIETIDGFVGQVIASTPSGAVIVWQTDAVEAKGKTDKDTGNDESYDKVKQTANDAIKKAIGGLFTKAAKS